jgi:CRP/FNR family transcriptional regulator, cyclic AMP receptor protein
MSTILQSTSNRENTGRTIRAQGMFGGLPAEVQEKLTASAYKKKFTDGQIVQHRGDDADGFWIILQGQVKLGHYLKNGEMQVLVILGEKDSFGELACLGRFSRVVDAEAVGATEMLWITEQKFSQTLLSSPNLNREILAVLAQQLQEALDNLLVYRKLPAGLRLVRMLLLLCDGLHPPVNLALRQQEMAELVGVSRVSISKTLALLESEMLLERGYGRIIISDPIALKRWMVNKTETPQQDIHPKTSA